MDASGAAKRPAHLTPIVEALTAHLRQQNPQRIDEKAFKIQLDRLLAAHLKRYPERRTPGHWIFLSLERDRPGCSAEGIAQLQFGYYEYATPNQVFKQQLTGRSDYRVELVWIKGEKPAERSTDAELEKGFALRRDKRYVDRGGEDDFEYVQKLLKAGALSSDRVSKIREEEAAALGVKNSGATRSEEVMMGKTKKASK